jgi:hypothetical protein
VDYGNVVGKLGLEHAVEVLRATLAHQAVLVGEGGEHADLIAVLELNAGRLQYEKGVREEERRCEARESGDVGFTVESRLGTEKRATV